MKYNISLAWYLFDGRGDTGVIVSPTLGNFVLEIKMKDQKKGNDVMVMMVEERR